MIFTVVYCTIIMVNKVLSEFFTNAAVALFAVGVLAPMFSTPTDILTAARYLGASIGTFAFIILAGLFEAKTKT